LGLLCSTFSSSALPTHHRAAPLWSFWSKWTCLTCSLAPALETWGFYRKDLLYPWSKFGVCSVVCRACVIEFFFYQFKYGVNIIISFNLLEKSKKQIFRPNNSILLSCKFQSAWRIIDKVHISDTNNCPYINSNCN